MSESDNSQYIRTDEISEDVKQPVYNQPPQKKKKRSKWLAFFVAIGILVACTAIACGLFIGDSAHDGPFSSGEKNVVMIDVNGEITEEGTTYNQKFILNQINEAKNDSDNEAILLMFNTPGGSVYECDEVHRKLVEYKKETKRPIYAYCEGMCASAGYYIATTADTIYANRNSLVGSIGVICGQFVDASGLLDKLGVHVTTVHSGANKTMGSMYEAPTDEQLAIMQAISDEAYEQFVDVVATGRDMSVEKVKALADGRVYSAKQGKANGLIDRIGTIDDMDAQIKKDLGDDVRFYHEVYEQSPYASLFNRLKSYLDTRGMSGELASSVKTIEGMRITEPMYLYQP